MREIKSLADLRQFIDSVNGFHDSILKRLEVVSNDTFDSKIPPGRILSERLDVKLVFVRQPGSTTEGGEVSLHLKDARGFSTQLPAREAGAFSDWGINDTEVDEVGPGLFRLRFISSIHKGGEWVPLALLEVPFSTVEIS